MPTAMIMLASEQIWPNLLGYLHFVEQGVDISHVYIFHSDDDRRSVQPARRIGAFLEQYSREIQHKEVEVVLSGNQPVKPQDVTAKLREWIEQPNRPSDWIVNVTGGLKLMLPGVLNLMHLHSNMRVVYSDFDNWFNIEWDETGQFLAHPFDVNPAPSLSDRVPLRSAMVLQSSHLFDLGEIWPHKLKEVVDQSIKNEWSWNQTAIDLNYPDAFKDKPKGGFLFEHFVAQTLTQIGAGQVAVNAKAASPHPGEENDVLCLHRSQLLLFDCKLTTEQQVIEKSGASGNMSLITEIHDARQRIRDLGGLNARGILLRPSRDYAADSTTSTIKEFAQSLGLTIWDRTEMSQFFDKLNELLFGKSPPALPSELVDVQTTLQEQLQDNYPIFAAFPTYSASVERREGGRFVNISSETSKAAKYNGHPHWWGHSHGDWLFLTLKKATAWTDDEHKRIVNFFSKEYSLQNNQIYHDLTEQKLELNLEVKISSTKDRQSLYNQLRNKTAPFDFA